MNGILITTANKSDLKLIADLANRIGAKSKQLSEDDLLDIGLLKAMEEGKKTKFVSRDLIMAKLQKDGN
jgi:hypothetical protein